MEKKQVESTLSRLNGVFWVSREHRKSGDVVSETEKETKIEVTPFDGEVARVGLDGAMTINVGNYQSVKIGVFLSVPCYVEEVPEVFEAVKATVEKRMAEEVAEVNEIKAKGGFR